MDKLIFIIAAYRELLYFFPVDMDPFLCPDSGREKRVKKKGKYLNFTKVSFE